MRLLMARPRLFICALIGGATFWLLPQSLAQQATTRVIIGWNVGACLYLLLAARMMFASSHAQMRARALQHEIDHLDGICRAGMFFFALQ